MANVSGKESLLWSGPQFQLGISWGPREQTCLFCTVIKWKQSKKQWAHKDIFKEPKTDDTEIRPDEPVPWLFRVHSLVHYFYPCHGRSHESHVGHMKAKYIYSANLLE